jgi:adenylosuccinate lyase
VGPASMKTFIQSLELPDDAKQRLLELTPHTYTGYAAALTAAVKSHNLK